MHFVSFELFAHEQRGFRSKHSCETALQSIIDSWKVLNPKNWYL